ncbi:membrane-associated proteins in eicosanoid and glutathione metabolism [Heliocybe sulcata]|uniref:Membrane-associated proteins in eicosanoid and glutathione metabolism n=1 Tax=Heliocybe sulcata TaxID=5364 RepID=A0A5C3NG02_9AGAM|nr:membrane-associated proteins in eicosanoid and glutathione metabolism [Heliocybe sulcata]
MTWQRRLIHAASRVHAYQNYSLRFNNPPPAFETTSTMSVTLVLPQGYTYVLASAVSILPLLTWQTYRVGKARAASGIKYPQLYAEKAEAEASKEALLFNCMQRAHQNTVELLPIILLGTLVTGLSHPYIAASLCTTFVISRAIYTIEYAAGNPSRRNARGGAFGIYSAGMLMMTATWTVGRMLFAELSS